MVAMGQAENELFELLQTKRADTSLETNEDGSTANTMRLYDDPPGRDEVNSWGEEGPKEGDRPNQAFHNSSGVWDESKKDRQGVVNLVFEGVPNTNKADQALISENFEHGKSGDFSAHSLHLQGKSVEKISHPRTPTLQERVIRIAGRI